MSAHSPGPWKASPPIDQVNDLFAEEYFFIEGPGADVHGHMNAHDARLIAAAPDLLAALRAVLSLIDRDAPQLTGKTMGQARAAVASVEGGAA